MQDHQNRFSEGMTQICADLDELVSKFTGFAEHHKGLAMAQQGPISPALGVIEGSVSFILNDIGRAREGDVLAALQVAHFLSTISTAISIFTENPAHGLAAGAGIYSEAIRQSLAQHLGG